MAPGGPWVPLGAIVTCGALMAELPRVTWVRFFLWLGVGLAIYFGYGARKSKLAREMQQG